MGAKTQAMEIPTARIQAMEMVTVTEKIQAMEMIPELGYVGWDIAVTPKGAELIEGNCHWPGGNIIQLDKIGKYPLIKECLK